MRVAQGTQLFDQRRTLAPTALALFSVLGLVVGGQVDRPVLTSNGGSSAASEHYGKLPLSFVPNRGQTDASVRYYAQAPGFGVYFTQRKAVLSLTRGKHAEGLELRFIGANPNAAITGGRAGPGRISDLNRPESYTNLRTYEQVRYRDIWPGIDLLFMGRAGRLKYEFHLRPGADASDIRLSYAGADGLSLNPAGNMAVHTSLGTLVDSRPRSYQRVAAKNVTVPSRFVLKSKRGYGFAVAAHNTSRSLVIDPGLAYSTYLGGSGTNVFDVAVDRDGYAYVVGQAGSDFPTTPGAYETTPGCCRAFVTKLSKDGSSLIYSTFIGGNTDSRGVAIDAEGDAYVTGFTFSNGSFPTTPGAYDTTIGGFADGYVLKLDPTGSRLLYSTFLGGSDYDISLDVAIDAADAAYVIGVAFSRDFPTTPNAFDATHNGGSAAPTGEDVTVTKLDPTGSRLEYSTFLGSPFDDFGTGIAVDGSGEAYVTGDAGRGFPTTPGAYDTLGSTYPDAFVTKLNGDGSGLLYSTLVGGSSPDGGNGIALDAAKDAYVTGNTCSQDFPTTPGAFMTTPATSRGFSCADAFVLSLSTTGSSLNYSTYLGGDGVDTGRSIAVDRLGSAYVAGFTTSTDFPVTANAFSREAFVTKLSSDGSGLAYSSYLGGSSFDESNAIAVDGHADAYVVGRTDSRDFPTTPGSFQPTPTGCCGGGFVTKFAIGPGPPATLTLSPKSATNTLDQGAHCVTATVRDAAENPTPAISVRFTVTGATTGAGTQTTNDAGEARFCYQGPELPGTDAITATVEPSGPSDTATKAWVAPSSTDGCRATGAGRIRAENGDPATFSQNVHAIGSGQARGKAQYTDHGPVEPLKATLKSIDALACDGSRATIFGRPTVGGTSVSYRVDLDDRGQGRRDTYRILLSTGYDSGTQPLTGGNLQVR